MFFAACSGSGATTAPTTAPESTAPESVAPASSAPAESSAPAVDYSGYKACVAFDTGGLGDKGFNSIITVGFNQAQATVEAVKANTDIAFAQVDAVWDEATNGPAPANFSGLDFQID